MSRFCFRRRSSPARRGAALVELAVCLPLLVLICMGVIEACSMIYMQQSLKIAAYESARVALVPGSTEANIRGQAHLILGGRRVTNWTATVNPTNRSGLRSGDFVTVTVSAPCDENSLLRSWFYRGRRLQSSVALMVD